MARERDLIARQGRPLTPDLIARELRRMGIGAGDTVLMHVALSRLGWVVGGAQGLLEAVTGLLGARGTLVMPGFSSQLSDPAEWQAPPVPAAWVAPIRGAMPLFDRDRTPTRGIGVVAEALRAWPDSHRSDHVRDSFLAWGAGARAILAQQPVSRSLGAGGPLGRLRAAGAKVLLMGAGFDACTAFHLAEEDLPGIALIEERYPVARTDGVTRWQSYAQPPTFEEHFAAIGAAYEGSGAAVRRGFDGRARAFDMAEAVDFARAWLVRAADAGELIQ